MFWGILKTQIVCRGAKVLFGRSVRVSKKGFRNKMCTFCFCFLYVGEEKKEKKTKKMENGNFKKAINSVFGGGCEQQIVFCRNGIF